MWIGLSLIIIALTWFVLAMSRAVVVFTEGGIYQRIMIPVGAKFLAWRADLAIHAEQPDLRMPQGPIVAPRADNRYEVSWVCGQDVQRELVTATEIDLQCRDHRRHIHWMTTQATQRPFSSDNNVAVISDLEGNLAYFLDWGKHAGVLDDAGRWAFGDGQLVILGDSVDRGRQVFDLLWKLHALEYEATIAGGAVHVILGNHEQYVLQGRLSSVEPEHLWATEQMMPYADAWSAQTVLGRWLRSKPIMLTLGDTLFVHGGISPSALQLGLTVEQWNQRHRSALMLNNHDPQVFGPTSPTQYRGYLYATDAYSLATQSHIEATLTQFGVQRIVVGHTQTEALTPRFNNRVFAIELGEHAGDYLMIMNHEPVVKQSELRKQRFRDPNTHQRQFELLNRSDWRAFFGVFITAGRSVFASM
ncbi:metallophosphoesterase [Arenicella chitinivorans]|nr:metallophosphoesterase [Arenicella chitinivorans]